MPFTRCHLEQGKRKLYAGIICYIHVFFWWMFKSLIFFVRWFLFQNLWRLTQFSIVWRWRPIGVPPDKGSRVIEGDDPDFILGDSQVFPLDILFCTDKVNLKRDKEMIAVHSSIASNVTCAILNYFWAVRWPKYFHHTNSENPLLFSYMFVSDIVWRHKHGWSHMEEARG